MGKFFLNVLLIILIGYAVILSYNNFVKSVDERISNEMQPYLSQNQAINHLQSSYPKPLTKKTVSEYDKKYNTHLFAALENSKTMPAAIAYRSYTTDHQQKQILESESTNTTLDFLKYENDQKISNLGAKKDGFWFYLPSTPAVIFGVIGIFFTTFITNVSNDFYKNLPIFLTYLRGMIKKLWQIKMTRH